VEMVVEMVVVTFNTNKNNYHLASQIWLA
jgi:hypothetical protein